MPRTQKSKNFQKDVEKAVKKMAETKIKDFNYAEEGMRSANNQPFVLDLTTISRNTESDGRIGNEVHCSGIKWRLLFHNRNNPNATGSVHKSLWVRMVLLQQRNVDNTTVLEKFFRQGSTAIDFDASSETQKYYLPVDQTNRKTLYQTTFKLGLNNSNYTANYLTNKILKKYKSINKKIHYELPDVANSASNKIYTIIWIGNSDMDATATNNAGYCEMTGVFSNYYKDF